MENFADQIKRLRKERGAPLREVAAYLNIDQAILSKIENRKRNATKSNVIKLAEYFNIPERDLVVSWLSDKIIYEIDNEELAIDIFKVAEEKIIYRNSARPGKERIIDIIRQFLEKDGRVAKAWVFGSFARGDYNSKSDIDLMVRFNDSSKMSLFDFADIAYLLEEKLKFKIDLVEEGFLEPFVLTTAKNDLKLIYE